MLTVLHAADLHLDSPFSGLSDGESAARRAELRTLPHRMTGLVKERGVQLVLLPGDLFDGERVYPETVAALKAALAEMAVPVFISPGNHDHCRPRSPYLDGSWPENVHIFTLPQLTCAEVPELNCAVHGYAFTAPHREDDPLAGFAAPKDGKTHLLCIHGEVAPSGTYAPISQTSLAHSGACYAALGHVHAASGLQRAGDTYWAYPGCPEGRGFDECGDKGVCLVTVDGDKVSSEFVPICQRRYLIETVQAEDFVPPAWSDNYVRLILRGDRTAIPSLAVLHSKWKDSFYHLELRDETAIPTDLWAREQEDSLTGLFLRSVKQRLQTADGEERETLLLAAQFGLAALEGGEDIRL